MSFWREVVAALRRDDPRQIVIVISTDEMLATLRAAASRRGVSVVEYIRQAVADSLHKDQAGGK